MSDVEDWSRTHGASAMGRTNGDKIGGARERLLDAARNLFRDRGYEATGIRAIAEQAGCNLSLIKYHFGSKEGLLRAVVASNASAVGGALQRGPAPGESMDEWLAGMTRFAVGFLDGNAELIRMVFRDFILSGRPGFEDLADRISENHARMTAMLAAAVRQGQVRPGVKPELGGLLLMGSLMFYFLAYPITSRTVGPRSPELLDELARTAADVFLHGVLRGG